MRRILLALTTMCIALVAQAQTADTMYIYRNNGNIDKIAVAKIDSITFTAPEITIADKIAGTYEGYSVKQSCVPVYLKITKEKGGKTVKVNFDNYNDLIEIDGVTVTERDGVIVLEKEEHTSADEYLHNTYGTLSNIYGYIVGDKFTFSFNSSWQGFTQLHLNINDYSEIIHGHTSGTISISDIGDESIEATISEGSWYPNCVDIRIKLLNDRSQAASLAGFREISIRNLLVEYYGNGVFKIKDIKEENEYDLYKSYTDNEKYELSYFEGTVSGNQFTFTLSGSNQQGIHISIDYTGYFDYFDNIVNY